MMTILTCRRVCSLANIFLEETIVCEGSEG